jgi:hypothetical protein
VPSKAKLPPNGGIRYVKATFFRGTSLRPVPPGCTSKDARWIDIHEDDLDETRMATWVKHLIVYGTPGSFWDRAFDDPDGAR